MKSLEHLNLKGSQRLEKFPQNLGRMKLELGIKLKGLVKREIPSFIIQRRAHLTELDFPVMKKHVALPNAGYVERVKGNGVKMKREELEILELEEFET